jgi:uncharacterized protein YkwD
MPSEAANSDVRAPPADTPIDMSRRIGIVLTLGVGALALTASPKAGAGDLLLAPEYVCPNPAPSAPTPAQVRAMLCYHRYARSRARVRDLRTSSRLFRSAALKAQWITACRGFTHTPCGHSLITAFSDAGYTRGDWSVGENLGWGTGSLAGVREMFSAWLRSPEHRRNILRPGWREIGLARIHVIHLFGSDDVTLWVAHFGSS